MWLIKLHLPNNAIMYLGNNVLVKIFLNILYENFIIFLDFMLLRKNDSHTISSHQNNIMLMGQPSSNNKTVQMQNGLGLSSQWLPSHMSTQQYPIAHSMVIFFKYLRKFFRLVNTLQCLQWILLILEHLFNHNIRNLLI